MPKHVAVLFVWLLILNLILCSFSTYHFALVNCNLTIDNTSNFRFVGDFFGRDERSDRFSIEDYFAEDILLNGTVFDTKSYKCFGNLNAAMNSKIKVAGNPLKRIPWLLGTTYWINDYMAVGHAMYDISLLQLLRISDNSKYKLSRVVLQRPPCATNDLCRGVGTWESFFKHFYTVASLAGDRKSNRIVPFYFRYRSNDLHWVPFTLGKNKSTPVPSLHSNSVIPNGTFEPIRVLPAYCFEFFVQRKCNNCFATALTAQAVIDFKLAAYSLLNQCPLQLLRHFLQLNYIDATTLSSAVNVQLSTLPRLITVVVRAESNRRYLVNTHPGLVNVLSETFQRRDELNPNASVQVIPRVAVKTFHLDMERITAEDQVHVMAESDIVIAAHGGFLSNLIYMRPDCLLIELVGKYPSPESENFRRLSAMFLVNHVTVTMSNLSHHFQRQFHIQENETDAVVQIIHTYLSRNTNLNES